MLRQFSDIKVFVISLAREKQRREAIQKRLNGICNTFEFFDAIDGKKERLSGWEKAVYPITRGAFKVIDGLIRKSYFFIKNFKSF